MDTTTTTSPLAPTAESAEPTPAPTPESDATPPTAADLDANPPTPTAETATTPAEAGATAADAVPDPGPAEPAAEAPAPAAEPPPAATDVTPAAESPAPEPPAPTADAPEALAPAEAIAVDPASETAYTSQEPPPADAPAAPDAPETTALPETATEPVAATELSAVPPTETPAADEAVVAEAPAPETATEASAETPPAEAETEAAPPGPSKEELLAAGQRWGFVDGEGNVRLRDPAAESADPEAAGRVVGKMLGDDPDAALVHFAGRFAQMERRAADLEAEAEAAPDRGPALGRIRRLLERAERGEALGDLPALTGRLRALEAAAAAQVEERRAAKEALVARAEELRETTAWKAAGDELRELREQLKAVRPAGRELDNALWGRFQAAHEAFHARRVAFFAERNQEWSVNRVKKDELAIRAEALADSDDFRATHDALQNLQAEWKGVGSAGREANEELWGRFRGAMDRFYERRAAWFLDNRRQKEEIVARADAVAASDDAWRQPGDPFADFLVEWRAVGPAGRGPDDALWGRLNTARQTFFGRRAAAGAERDRELGDNLRRLADLAAAAENLTFSNDPAAAGEEARALEARWAEVGQAPPDRVRTLERRFRAACDRVYVLEKEELTRSRREWALLLRDALLKKREQAARLVESITTDEGAIAELDAAPIDVDDSEALTARRAEAADRLTAKRAQLAELQASIRETEATFRG